MLKVDISDALENRFAMAPCLLNAIYIQLDRCFVQPLNQFILPT